VNTLNLRYLLYIHRISWKKDGSWLICVRNLRIEEWILVSWWWRAHNSVNIVQLGGWQLISLKRLDSLYYFHSMESKYNSKVFLEISVCDVLDNLSINANLFELFTVLRKFQLGNKPVSHILGVPTLIWFELLSFGG